MTGARIDRTYLAVKRQLQALGNGQFELGVYHRERDVMRNFELTTQEVLKRINWLRRENTNGCDIYIRPKGSQGLVFFDDLPRTQIDALRRDGLAPSVVVESSPGNFHGWVKVSEQPISTELATTVCKLLAARYGGDKDSADWRHYGRLAGFTNRKPQHVTELGQYPFVMLSSSSGKLAEAAEGLLISAQQWLDKNRVTAIARPTEVINDVSQASGFYLSRQADLLAQYGRDIDTSKADWMIVKQMVSMGFSENAVRRVLCEHSLALAKRKGNHADKYLDVTLSKAFDGRLIKQ